MRAARGVVASAVAGLLGWIAWPAIASVLPAAPRALPLAFVASRVLAWALSGATGLLLRPQSSSGGPS